MRWWDEQGNLLLSGEERADLEREQKEQAQQQLQQSELLLEQERQQRELAQQRAERLAQRLRDMGVNPDE
ncbi:hypothetical protein [Nostoc sp. WHI]|uniref:hypothetical protein n=1 Tax=Nostoc sp. WHI TaxID=2650611 RepID=UPI0018C57F67|nr:hypothetical protein [Nostoc sp. WHI]MBG1271518.1 hypothetical protein [Nostoc sp. WHI]